MKLGEFQVKQPQILHLEASSNNKLDRKKWQISEEVQLLEDAGSVYLSQGDQLLEVITDDMANLQRKAGQQSILWYLAKTKKNYLFIRGTLIVDAPVQMDFDIGIDSRVTKQLLDAQEIGSDSIAKATQWFNEEFLLQGTEHARLFTCFYAQNRTRSLQIQGRNYKATLEGLDGFWLISKLNRSVAGNVSLKLLQGRINFVDNSVAAQLKNPTHKKQLNELVNSHGSYMQLWRQYNDAEWSLEVSHARELGSIKYEEKGIHEGKLLHWDFIVRPEQAEQFIEKLQNIAKEDNAPLKKITLEVTPCLPDWLDNEVIIQESGLGEDKKDKKPWLCNFVAYEDGILTLKVDAKRDREPHNAGFISLSMHGYRKVRQRREDAINLINSRGNPMPQLHFLLEGVPVPYEEQRKQRSLSPEAKKRFKGPATKKQKEALYVALNTPDVALIIGPPGTGKTQVITALQVRLAEVMKDVPVQHMTLLTSFQHDAVDNMQERSNVFGLPAIKKGGKRDRDNDANDPLVTWCQDKAVLLESKLEKLINNEPAFLSVKSLEKCLVRLRVTRTDSDEKHGLVNDINISLDKLAEHQIRLSPEVQERWNEAAKDLLSSKAFVKLTNSNSALLRNVRALRVTEVSFMDDGKQQSWRLLDSLKMHQHVIPSEHLAVLTETASLQHATDNKLKQLKHVKNRLLEQLLPDYRPKNIQQVLDEALCKLLDDINEDIRDNVSKHHSLGYLQVLAEYLSALRYSPRRMESAVETYAAVLAATCQQSASRQMANVKDVEHTSQIQFNSVIVDEAARANPLDLMVPIAMGDKRIVLVGDHRQLPHLIQSKVEDELDDEFELSQVQQEMLDQSMFERLMKTFLKLEKEHNQPQRVVMLDTQFRMHPVLGDFVSRNFYERHGLDAVKSILSEDLFSHSVAKFDGKLCGWINVNASRGRAYKKHGSLQRDAEAEEIARYAKEILEGSPELSVGVITFYSAQVNKILVEMEKISLTEKRDDQYRIKQEWLTLTDDSGAHHERFRVGTVDAFQGKEFDVVLLSIVRGAPPQQLNMQDEKALNQAYGFLRLDNRLNVAMSRQKNLLIAFGDIDLATHPATEEVVPALFAFHQLCESEHGSVFK
ncbi:DEAD/DEAH box helicase [Pelagibaculum spongiae]|uniref:AAA+ ATPase domain-containing protein n=1 Tax=Pelagibaculum spongiae TaxID=2080658 RepID=A0A2V1GP75_9GAMM|nr:AAA domain-containing protein [Pelagibaculum spongiae]PVZ64504.1 hypothetical protein DC094_19520 [Pelagibaculum spongiae]